MITKYRVETYSDYHKAWSKLDTFDTLEEARNQAKHCDKWQIVQVIEQVHEWNFKFCERLNICG